MSGGGVHESLDGGTTWRVLIKGMEVVQGFNLDETNPTCHDPHSWSSDTMARTRTRRPLSRTLFANYRQGPRSAAFAANAARLHSFLLVEYVSLLRVQI